MKFETPTNEGRDAALRCPRPRAEGGSCAAERGAVGAARRPCPESAFTLAEVLAALLFLAIVIPAVVETLHVASLAGEVAARKGAAARVADRVLNESLVLTNWNNGTQNGTVAEGAQEFRWTVSSQNWPPDAMQLVTAEVKYTAQGRDYSVKLSTLASLPTLNAGMSSRR